MNQKMKHVLLKLARFMLGVVLIGVADIAMILMLVYYQEPEGIWPALLLMVSFIGACICLNNEKDE